MCESTIEFDAFIMNIMMQLLVMELSWKGVSMNLEKRAYLTHLTPLFYIQITRIQTI